MWFYKNHTFMKSYFGRITKISVKDERIKRKNKKSEDKENGKKTGKECFKIRKTKNNNKRLEKEPTENIKWGRKKEINNLKSRITNLRNASVILVKEEMLMRQDFYKISWKQPARKETKNIYSKENKIETAEP